MHSVGAPLAPGEADVPWPCNPDNKYIVHFPETREIWSYGSGYGGNALLGKKCFALRIASVMARDDGWLAEHMLILKLTNPDGRVEVHRRRVPVGVRQDQPGDARADDPGWKAETVGDDICWMKFGDDGRLYAINPEAGFFGVAPGTGYDTNANAMETLWGNCIFTNTALTDDGDVWWEGMTDDKPRPRHRLAGQPVDARDRDAGRPPQRPLHRARRRSARRSRPSGRTPPGVPISAILFGGRRRTTVPLVTEAFDWEHGVFLGSIMAVRDHRRPAGRGRQAALRPDGDAAVLRLQHGRLLRPLAGDRQEHRRRRNLPKIFFVNWFRRDDDGRFLWPGFGENSRVLKWVFERVDGDADAVETPIGLLPTTVASTRHGLDDQRRRPGRRC